MEESNSALEEEKAKLEERIRFLEAKILDQKKGLGYTRKALEEQYEELYELERNGPAAGLEFAWNSSVMGTKQKISHYEEDKQTMTSRIKEYSGELDSCKERLKEITVLIADSTVR